MTEFIEADWDAPDCVHAYCTTRQGGVSLAPFDSFNLALHVGDDRSQVLRNRARLRARLSLPQEPSWLTQTHGTRTVILESDPCRDADAAISRARGQIAVVMTADCLPILLCNRQGTEVAAVHAGWRGLEAGVIGSAIDAMASDPGQLLAWIGPGISKTCYEVGDEVRDAFIARLVDAPTCFSAQRRGHWLCDLAGLAELLLRQQGVAQVFQDPHCSFRDSGRFYSYRRDSTTGRMASLIWID